MSVTVQLLAPGQHASFLRLLAELHAHHVRPPTATADQIRAHFKGHLLAQPDLLLAVACDAAQDVLGFAALMPMYSLVEPDPAACRQLLMKELYVRAQHRGRGVGRLLVQWSAAHALHLGCSRMDWNVQSTNLKGISFYRSLGGRQVEDRLSFRLSADGLVDLARGER